jgi:hypothetical protein
LTSDRLYAGGEFTVIGGENRNRLAALTYSGQVVPSWNPNASHWVYSLAIDGTTIYVGGRFSVVGGAARPFLAALDTTTGAATDWNPQANDNVLALLAGNSVLLVGGQFTGIGNQARGHFAQFGEFPSDGTVLPSVQARAFPNPFRPVSTHRF